MKRFRLLIAAALFGLVTTATACSSDLVGPNPSQPSADEVPGFGQGGFGSGG